MDPIRLVGFGVIVPDYDYLKTIAQTAGIY